MAPEQEQDDLSIEEILSSIRQIIAEDEEDEAQDDAQDKDVEDEFVAPSL